MRTDGVALDTKGPAMHSIVVLEAGQGIDNTHGSPPIITLHVPFVPIGSAKANAHNDVPSIRIAVPPTGSSWAPWQKRPAQLLCLIAVIFGERAPSALLFPGSGSADEGKKQADCQGGFTFMANEGEDGG